MVELVIRLVFSLTVVIGLLIALARMSAKRFRGSSGALVQVVHRQALSRGSALAVVTIGSRVLVLGTTEQQVQLLTELDPEELVLSPAEGLVLSPAEGLVLSPAEEPSEVLDETLVPVPATGVAGTRPAPTIWPPRLRPGPAQDPSKSARRMRALGAARASDGALAGSLLSAQTWKQAFTAAIGGNDRDAS